jgi:hypothetical protein
MLASAHDPPLVWPGRALASPASRRARDFGASLRLGLCGDSAPNMPGRASPRMILAMVASTSVSVSVSTGSAWWVLPVTRASSGQEGADGP